MNNWSGKHVNYGMAKVHKMSLNKRIWLLVHKIKQLDKAFNALNQNDIDESFQRIKYFIIEEQNLDMLDNFNFKLLIKQIENFYKTNESESLVDWNYKIHIFDDYKAEETIAKIVKDTEDLNDSFTYQTNDKINMLKEDDNANFSSHNKVKQVKQNLHDVTLACEDEQIKTHKQVIFSSSPELNSFCTDKNTIVVLERQEIMSEQVYTTLSEELLNDICEEISACVLDEIEECSESIYETLKEELLATFCEEIHSEIIMDVSIEITEEVCYEVSTELSKEVGLEILTEILMPHNPYKELVDELCDDISKENFNIKCEKKI